MYKIELEDWELESGHYISQNRKVKDLNTNRQYSIETISEEIISLKPIPYYTREKAEILEITFQELYNGFSNGVLFIEGFELSEDRQLKIAINSVLKKIKIAKKEELISAKEAELGIERTAKETLLSEKAEREAKEEEKRKGAELRAQAEEERLAKVKEEKEAKELQEKEAARQRKIKAEEIGLDIIAVELSLE